MNITRTTSTIAMAALAISAAPALAAGKEDIVGIYAVLSAYMEICVPKEDPPPIEKVVAVVHAARLAGIDMDSAAFKREAAKRKATLTSTTPLMGTRRWCETMKHQVDVDYEVLRAAYP
jgi:hypothetical protein